MQAQTVGGGVADLIGEAFDRHRYTGERAGVFTGGELAIDGVGLGEYIVRAVFHHGIQPGIDRIQPRQCIPGGFPCGDFTAADLGREIGGGEAPEVGHRS